MSVAFTSISTVEDAACVGTAVPKTTVTDNNAANKTFTFFILFLWITPIPKVYEGYTNSCLFSTQGELVDVGLFDALLRILTGDLVCFLSAFGGW